MTAWLLMVRNMNSTCILTKQQGIATVLILLLTGLTLSIMVLGTMAYVRATQSTILATHENTQAQLRAWTGVEVVRKYLEAIGWDTAATLNQNDVLTFTNFSGIRAYIAKTPDSTNKYLTVNVIACSDTSNTKCTDGSSTNTTGATSAIQVVYSLADNDKSSGSGSDQYGLNIKGNVSANGDITFTGSKPAVVNIDGSFSTSSGVTGITALYATGAIDIGGSGGDGNLLLAANSDITLSGSGTYGTLKSLTNITMSGSTQAVNVLANGNVTLSNGLVNNVTAIGNVALTGGSTHADSVKTSGDTSLKSGSANITTLRGTGNLTEGGNTWVTDGIVGGTASLSKNSSNHVVTQSGYAVSITPLSAVTIALPEIDAYDYIDMANYVFSYDGSHIKVKVANVNGIDNGDYFLYQGTINNVPYNDYLCTSATPTAAQCIAKIAKGHSAYNTTISYSSGKFYLNGISLAPGIVFIKGDLEISNGTYYDTFIVTGNINTKGSSRPYAVNYAGYANVCNNADYTPHYPTNICNISTSTFNSTRIGDVALLAGSYTNGTFSGGIIDLGASNEVHGDVVAGDVLTTGGNTTIYGQLTVAHQSNSTMTTKMQGKTTIILDSPPDTYIGDGLSGNETMTTPNAAVLWSRYL